MQLVNPDRTTEPEAVSGFIIDELSANFGASVLNFCWNEDEGYFVLTKCPTGYVEIKLDPSELKQLGKELIAAADARLSVKPTVQT